MELVPSPEVLNCVCGRTFKHSALKAIHGSSCKMVLRSDCQRMVKDHMCFFAEIPHPNTTWAKHNKTFLRYADFMIAAGGEKALVKLHDEMHRLLKWRDQ